jgi:hypothetical protein
LEVDHAEELVGVDRLDEKGRELWRGQIMHFVLDFVQWHAGEEDDGQAAAVLLEVGEDAEAVDFGHVQVEEDEVDLAVFHVQNRGVAVAGFVDLKP